GIPRGKTISTGRRTGADASLESLYTRARLAAHPPPRQNGASSASTRLRMHSPSQRWDIFCAVVDNYGDAGIAWRLARLLASEHALPVRLYVDALPTLARLVPSIDPVGDGQSVAGVEVCGWWAPRSAF